MKTSATPDVRRLYEDSAEHYATMMDTEIDLPVYADTLGRLALRIAMLRGPVIDTSCGPGHMLARYRDRYDPRRALVAVDLSPAMIAITRSRLGQHSEVHTGDMRDLSFFEERTAAAVVSFYALHHIAPAEAVPTLREWHRVLRPGGQLLLATWEGAGAIDYDGMTDVVALRYTADEVRGWTEEAGFTIDRCSVEPVEEMPMDAIYVEATRPG